MVFYFLYFILIHLFSFVSFHCFSFHFILFLSLWQEHLRSTLNRDQVYNTLLFPVTSDAVQQISKSHSSCVADVVSPSLANPFSPSPKSPATTTPSFASMCLTVLNAFCKSDPAVLVFCVWLISLSIIPPGSSMWCIWQIFLHTSIVYIEYMIFYPFIH